MAAQKLALSSRLCDQAPVSLYRSLPLTFLALCTLFGASYSGPADGPVIALHSSTVVAKGSLCGAFDPVPCADFAVSRPLSPHGYSIFLVATKVDSVIGVSGLSCGISMPTLIAESSPFLVEISRPMVRQPSFGCRLRSSGPSPAPPAEREGACSPSPS